MSRNVIILFFITLPLFLGCSVYIKPSIDVYSYASSNSPPKEIREALINNDANISEINLVIWRYKNTKGRLLAATPTMTHGCIFYAVTENYSLKFAFGYPQCKFLSAPTLQLSNSDFLLVFPVLMKYPPKGWVKDYIKIPFSKKLGSICLKNSSQNMSKIPSCHKP